MWYARTAIRPANSPVQAPELGCNEVPKTSTPIAVALIFKHFLITSGFGLVEQMGEDFNRGLGGSHLCSCIQFIVHEPKGNHRVVYASLRSNGFYITH
jgi:hypothetical protein